MYFAFNQRLFLILSTYVFSRTNCYNPHPFFLISTFEHGSFLEKNNQEAEHDKN